MSDRIYVTYTPTTVPGSYHTAIHYERTDPAGSVIQHFVIEAKPEKLDELSVSDKAVGVIEEAFRNDDGPSRFGRINATARGTKASDDLNAPYETIAEGEDLSGKLARMQLFAHGCNQAGFAYRGDRRNSNTFAAAALRAGELPPATGVAHDPAGPPGELLEFFAPGLNEPLRAPIGPHASYEPTRSPVLRELQRLAVPGGPASTWARAAAPAAAALQPDVTAKVAESFLAKFVGDSPITPAPPPEPAPLLGIVSGKPMAPWPLPPTVFGLPDYSGASGKSDWSKFPAGLASPNPTPPAPPPTADSKPVRILARRIVGQPQASVSDTSAPAAPLAPSDDANFSGGLLGRLAALAGIDPRDPTQLAPPPLDDRLRGFYRDDPSQPWFAQRQR